MGQAEKFGRGPSDKVQVIDFYSTQQPPNFKRLKEVKVGRSQEHSLKVYSFYSFVLQPINRESSTPFSFSLIYRLIIYAVGQRDGQGLYICGTARPGGSQPHQAAGNLQLGLHDAKYSIALNISK